MLHIHETSWNINCARKCREDWYNIYKSEDSPGWFMQTVLAGAPPAGTSGHKSSHNLNMWGWMCTAAASQHRVGCIIANGVQFYPRTHFQYCVKAQPHSRAGLFFFFFLHPTCLHHIGVSAPAPLESHWADRCWFTQQVSQTSLWNYSSLSRSSHKNYSLQKSLHCTKRLTIKGSPKQTESSVSCVSRWRLSIRMKRKWQHATNSWNPILKGMIAHMAHHCATHLFLRASLPTKYHTALYGYYCWEGQPALSYDW